MTDDGAPTTPAGWHDDGSGQLRWWDGVQWTDNFAPATEPPQNRSRVTKGGKWLLAFGVLLLVLTGPTVLSELYIWLALATENPPAWVSEHGGADVAALAISVPLTVLGLLLLSWGLRSRQVVPR